MRYDERRGKTLRMGRSEEYRWFAGRCLEIARHTADTQTRAAMLQMAQVWLRLADEIEASGERPQEGSAANGEADGPG